MGDMISIPIADAEASVSRVFQSNNVSGRNARSVARSLVLAEIDGQKGHGLSRIDSYCAQSKSGKVDGFAEPELSIRKAGTALINVNSGFAYPAFDLADDVMPDIVQNQGIAGVAFTNSHHFGVAGHQVERFAEKGIFALAFGNTPKAIAPWGAKVPLLGTNPLAFACPRPGGMPIVVDLAVSQVARGKIMAASKAGEAIPEGWAFDGDGEPTTDPKAALGGTMAPMGGAKGAALALVIELLAVSLGAANFGYEATSFFDGEGAPPHVGQLLILIDPAAFGTSEATLSRVGDLASAINEMDGARLPGAGREAKRAQARESGLPLSKELWDSLNAA